MHLPVHIRIRACILCTAYNDIVPVRFQCIIHCVYYILATLHGKVYTMLYEPVRGLPCTIRVLTGYILSGMYSRDAT